jgi:ketosteroid isomerase-like protein
MLEADLATLARQYYEAFQRGDKSFVAERLSPDFTFTSPYDEAIDAETFFERCWPPLDQIPQMTLQQVVADGDTVLVAYEVETRAGGRFHNMERLGFQAGRLNSVEVFFGDPPAGVERGDFQAFIETARPAWSRAHGGGEMAAH